MTEEKALSEIFKEWAEKYEIEDLVATKEIKEKFAHAVDKFIELIKDDIEGYDLEYHPHIMEVRKKIDDRRNEIFGDLK